MLLPVAPPSELADDIVVGVSSSASPTTPPHILQRNPYPPPAILLRTTYIPPTLFSYAPPEPPPPEPLVLT